MFDDEKEKTSDSSAKKEDSKDISEKTWEEDDDWMDDPSGINPGC
jgi:hypothetical protein